MKIGDMVAPRNAFGEALVELGDTEPEVVVFDADVGASTQAGLFGKKYPDRFFQMGIAEANMVCAAAGMSTMGFVPWVSTFAVFLAKRAADQIRVSIAYPKLNVKLNGAYGGIPTGKAGATHQAIQDIAVMRAMPNMTVVVTADANETRQAVLASAKHKGPLYLRTVRCPVPVIFDDKYKFEIGPGSVLTDGGDVAIIATGMMTAKAMAAAKELDAQGLKARVIHLPTIKPIDQEIIVKASKDIGKIISVENHSCIGGLGGAVAEVLTEYAPCYLKRLGFPDVFGESGDNEKIFSKYGVNVENIVEAAGQMAKGN